MTDAERKEAARKFCNKWLNRGEEKKDDQSFWIDFLQNVMGIENAIDYIQFQKDVVGPNNKTKWIDAYIPETRILIEQKSLDIDLGKPQAGHDGMTPYEQAKMYDNGLTVDEKARWIILSNFAEFWIYNMHESKPEPVKISLIELPTKYDIFDFLVNQKQKEITKEVEVSVKAGELVGLIYDALLKQYIDPHNDDSLRSLNMLCVRLVFCLYAEDAHIFGSRGRMFHDYLEQFETKDLRKALIEFFKVLDTKTEDRDPYDKSLLSEFPYVNGGLFENENIEIPNFTEEIRDILLSKASDNFDWSLISPTIFGAVFESTLNPETRHMGGMHYTSRENIHKVIDPLFLNELNEEFEQIDKIQIEKIRNQKLINLQNKLSSLTWLDPACGSGNFLTETYISIRRLENRIISRLIAKRSMEGQMAFGTNMDASDFVKVSISQFHGIEINDFAATVAKTALWIAESQMLKETENLLLLDLDFLPLKTNAYIHEANALKIDWKSIIAPERLSYIMGNPPFLGAKMMKPEQKEEATNVFGKIKLANSIDYVGAWYFKASEYIQNTNIKCAFVSTNSICQGEQTAALWKPLVDKYDISINFAYTSFVWDSEASQKAKVHCVIVGFSTTKMEPCFLFDSGERKEVSCINSYLIPGEQIFIEKRSKPICKVPVMTFGNMPVDDGNLIFTASEKEDFIKKYPETDKYFKKYVGATEFLNRTNRYCLWLKDIPAGELKRCPGIMERIENVRNFRLNSTAEPTKEKAATPYLFFHISHPSKDYLIVPKTTSGRRRYVPIGYETTDTIASDLVNIIEDASLYTFGILSSNMHNAWIRMVAGRLKSDYRYTNGVVYNTFPWPNATTEQRNKIEITAQAILDVRQKYADESLSALYDPRTMPKDLLKAHSQNDKAVMQAYGLSVKDTSEAECVAYLMKEYQKLTTKG